MTTPAFLDALHCEWLKRRRSHGAWLVVGGALFTPSVVLLVRLTHRAGLPALYADPAFWTSMWRSCWESMAIFLMPLTAMLATSLVVQIEVRNHAWKQVHALPLTAFDVYFAKFAVILLMLGQFLLLFVLGIGVAAWLPAIAFHDVPWPPAAMPLRVFAAEALGYFVDCLPIVTAQYLMSLRFDNFMAPIGIGFLAWIGGLAALSWPHAHWIPYAYPMLDYLKDEPAARIAASAATLHGHAAAWFAVLTAAGYALFVARPDKG